MLTNKMHSSVLAVSLLALHFYSCFAQTNVRNSTFQVGIILDLDSLVGRMGMTSLSLAASDFYSVQRSTELVLHVRDSNGRVIDAAGSALSLLKDVEVDAIIGPQKSAQASFVIGLGESANVPIISFSATSPFHPESPYFLHAAIEDSFQVGAIASLLEYFKWNQVVVITEESEHGNDIIPSLMNAFQDVNVRISHRSVIPVAANNDYILKELYEMKTMQTRVFVVHMSSSLASRLFLKAKEAGMMTRGYAWIVTSGLMDLFYSLDSRVIESMEGVIGVKPLIQKSERLDSVAKRWRSQFLKDNLNFSRTEMSLYAIWAYDAIWALSMAAERVRFTEPSSLRNSSLFFNSSNPFISQVSRTGSKLRDAMSEITFEGLGGTFRLVDRQLEPSFYQILNVVGNSEREVGIWTASQGLTHSDGNVSSPDTKLKKVMFPGDTTDVPKGWEVPVSGKKLRIGVPPKAGFPEFFKVDKDSETNVSIYSGCFIDMFRAVMRELPYAVDYEFFTIEDSSGATVESYDEFSRQVSLQNYDGAVGDISITYERSVHVDFTFPFTPGGVTKIVKKTYTDRKWFFIKPFEKELWYSIIALFIFTGIALWILEHRFNVAYRGNLANHAGMIFYVPFMSMVYAQREKVVNNLARVVIVVWMFVVLMLTSTYTASLSALLTVDTLKPSRVTKTGDYVGCRKGSFIHEFLQHEGYENIRTYQNVEDIDKALSDGTEKGGISAFYAAKPYTDLFLSSYDNKYRTDGPTYPYGGYAFVFTKGSPLVADVSRAVIKLTQRGDLAIIERQLKKPKSSNEDLNSYKAITLRSFRGLFVISGTTTATCVLVFLAMYVYENRDFIRRISNSNTTTWSKLRAISKNFDQRDPKSFRSSMAREEDDEENTSPRRGGNNHCSSTVVPVSSPEINDANEVSSLNSEHAAASTGQTR